MNEFTKQLHTLSERVLEVLEKNSEGLPSASPTTWELKLHLKTSLSQLYMALGTLIHQGRIRIVPEGLTYRIHFDPIQTPMTDIQAVSATQKN